MGVYIPNVEMPRGCNSCPLAMEIDSICSLTMGGCTKDKRPPHCPLIEIDEPKAGRWIPYKAYFGKKKDSWTDELKCSECGYEWGDEDYNFCPNCGSKMERRADEHNIKRD